MSIFLNTPVIGSTPSIYSFPNLLSTLHPFINPFIGSNVIKMQLYNQLGALYPSILAGVKGLNLKEHENIKIYNFNNKKINVGIFGSNKDVLTVKKILEDYDYTDDVKAVVKAVPKTTSVTPLDAIYPDIEYSKSQNPQNPQLYIFNNPDLFNPYLNQYPNPYSRGSYFDSSDRNHRRHRDHRDYRNKTGGTRHRYRDLNEHSPYNQYSPYSTPIDEIQFYNPFTGALGPSVTSSNSVNSANYELQNLIQRQYPTLNNRNIIIINYNNTKINVGIFGSENDVTLVKKIIEAHFNPTSDSFVGAISSEVLVAVSELVIGDTVN